MEIQAKLISVGNETSGTSQNGDWKKTTAIFETEEQYPKTIAIDFWKNEKKDTLSIVKKIPIGTSCIVKFDISSREYNGKWYTNCTAFGINDGVAQPKAVKKQQEEDPNDDLPW